MNVRLGHQSDLNFIVSCQKAMTWETEALRLDAELVRKGCQAVIDDSKKGSYWIVEKGNVPVCMCLTIPEWSDWRNGTVLWIHSVYTLSEHRGTGAYRALYGFLKNKVETDPNLRGLRLYVDKRNTVAQRVYSSLGMSDDHYLLYEWMKS